MIAVDPECGALIEGGVACARCAVRRSVAWQAGGVRIVYYYHDLSMPVFLLTMFAKNERDDLSRRELNRLAGSANR